MKNIIATIATIIVIGLMAYTASNGGAYHGGEHAKVIEDIGEGVVQNNLSKVTLEKDDRKKESDALNALRDKAGNAGSFQVSQAYKSKCSSCHGVNGSGFQNGKAMMGPKLFGQSEDKIYTDLVEFKAGRKENIIMKGLLLSMDKEDFRAFAKEIGEFPQRAKNLEK